MLLGFLELVAPQVFRLERGVVARRHRDAQSGVVGVVHLGLVETHAGFVKATGGLGREGDCLSCHVDAFDDARAALEIFSDFFTVFYDLHSTHDGVLRELINKMWLLTEFSSLFQNSVQGVDLAILEVLEAQLDNVLRHALVFEILHAPTRSQLSLAGGHLLSHAIAQWDSKIRAGLPQQRRVVVQVYRLQMVDAFDSVDVVRRFLGLAVVVLALGGTLGALVEERHPPSYAVNYYYKS